MDTCITLWHFPTHDRWYDDGLALSMRAIAAAGFTHVNWNVDAGSSYIYAPSEIGYFAGLLADVGLKGWSLHGSNGRNTLTEIGARGAGGHWIEGRKDYLSPNEWQRLAGVDLIRNRIHMAAAIGARSVVMHVEFPNELFRRREQKDAAFAALHRSFDDLREDCERHDVRIAVENLPTIAHDDMIELLDRIFERHPGSVVGLCYDCGHGEIARPGDVSLLTRFGDRLFATHLHDNDGMNDLHLLPGDGRIDFTRVLDAIAATPYELPLTFETPHRLYGAGYFVPEPAFYERAHAVIARSEAYVRALRAKAA